MAKFFVWTKCGSERIWDTKVKYVMDWYWGWFQKKVFSVIEKTFLANLSSVIVESPDFWYNWGWRIAWLYCDCVSRQFSQGTSIYWGSVTTFLQCVKGFIGLKNNKVKGKNLVKSFVDVPVSHILPFPHSN